MNGRVQALKVLVELGADSNAKDLLHGFSALHNAVYQGHVESAKTLVELGADLNAQVAQHSYTHFT